LYDYLLAVKGVQRTGRFRGLLEIFLDFCLGNDYISDLESLRFEFGYNRAHGSLTIEYGEDGYSKIAEGRLAM